MGGGISPVKSVQTPLLSKGFVLMGKRAAVRGDVVGLV
jgi:hypothetical protein